MKKTESLKFKLSAQYLSLFSMFFIHYKQNKYHNSNWELIILDDFLLHTITDKREIKILFKLLEKRSE